MLEIALIPLIALVVWLTCFEDADAQGIEAGTDETATQARPEGQEPGSQSECAKAPPESPNHDK